MAQAPQTQKAAPKRKTKSTVVIPQAVKGDAYRTAPPNRVTGVDVSQYQGTINWTEVVNANHLFAFIKATQADGRMDPMFAANWEGAGQAGILRGAYHVFDHGVSPEEQADGFIKALASMNGTGELPPVLDIEPSSSYTSSSIPLADVAKVWLDRVEKALGRKPILYGNTQTFEKDFVSADGAVPTWVSDHPLWIAQYPTRYSPDLQPRLPRTWPAWTFWQFTERGEVPGIQGSVDLNVFNGSEEDLRRFAGSPVTAELKTRLNFALNDRPQGPDRLDYERYADAFAQVLSGQYTQTPLTVGIYASWGMGKSFLLGKVRDKLNAIKAKSSDKLDFAFIDFNAWVYSGSENLWAGLVTTLYDGIEKHYKARGSRLVQDYRRKESLKQLWRTFQRSIMLVLVFGIPAAIISLLLDYQAIQESWKTIANTILLILGGAPLLSKIPDLLKGLRALIDSVVLLRSQELAKLSSRKDFRDQVGFMADIQSELRHISDLIKALDARNEQKTRFIIFVDDLDRCPPGKAVEVLEAIMLLLSDRNEDPFIIFLAMDARVLVKAVEMRYGEVLKDSGISGYEFLDKIVQIPFRIPPSSDDSIKRYIQSLLYQSLEAQTKAEQPPEEETEPAQEDQPSGPPQPREAAPQTQPGPASTPAEESTPVAAPPAEEPFTPGEKEAFEGYARFISRNPRRVKRIVNIYRMARILVSAEVPPQTAVKWTILTEQWPFRIAWVMQLIEDDIQLGREISMDWTLADVYERARGFVHDENSHHLALLDEDGENFEAFIQHAPQVTVGDIHKLWSVTFNLNPAMQNEVLKSAIQNGVGMAQEKAA